MGKFKFASVISLFSIASFSLSGQVLIQQTGEAANDFQSYVRQMNDWRGQTPVEEQKGSKWIQRWIDFNESRTNAKGALPSNEVFLNEAVKIADEKWQNRDGASRASDSTWYPSGPDTLVPGNTASSSHGVARVNCIEFHPTDPNTYWVGVSQGGIWKTTNSGKSYTPLNNNLPILRISDIEVDPNNPEILYISVGDYAYLSVALNTDGRKRNTHYGLGVYKSVDGGKNWSSTGLSYKMTDFDQSLVRRVYVNPNDSKELVAVGISGVWKSYDAGDNWTQKLNNVMWDLEMNPLNSNSLMATSGWILNLNIGEAKIWKSTDFGENWSSTISNIPVKDTVQRIEVTYSKADTNYCYAVCCDRARGMYAFYKSTNSGLNWTQQIKSRPNILEWGEGKANGGQGTYDLCIMVDQKDKNKVFTGGVNVWGSPDGGATWNGVSYWLRYYGFTPHADQHFMSYNPLDKKYYVCNDGGIFRTDSILIGDWDSTNIGGYQFPTKWEDVSSGMQITSFYRLGTSAENPGIVVAGAQDNGTYYKGKNGKWTNISGGDGMDCIVDDVNADNIITTSQFGSFYSSRNGGQSSSYSGKMTRSEAAGWTTPVVKIPGNNFEFLAGYENLYKGNAWGGGFLYSRIPSSNDNPISSLSIGDKDAQHIVVAKRVDYLDNENSELWITYDGGRNWKNKSSGLPDSLYFTSVVIDDRDSNLIWVTVAGFINGVKVYRSNNGGDTWMNISRNLPNIPVNIIVQDQRSLHNPVYLGTDIGVYYTNDSLTNWMLFSKELPNVIVSDLEIQPKEQKLYASTFGRGIWSVSTLDTLHIWPEDTIVKEEPKDTSNVGLPQSSLQQSNDIFELYPNPSNGHLNIKYDISEAGEYSLELINIMGKVVSTERVSLSQGPGQHQLNFDVLSGSYFLKIKGSGKPQVVRLKILRE